MIMIINVMRLHLKNISFFVILLVTSIFICKYTVSGVHQYLVKILNQKDHSLLVS